ncbi:hypothetical protein DFH08DRAFT_437650 [Mycena albidolilacea]|uniref:C2H2-type domain-containing protein n=1 Tax=Mycena albidolilacea TaxID=1033008 RepID=A0AAD7AGC9_9AGAR|nr:hypothetical protein DFH08DRAFT_437650 [Mycena albidolilacea]
MDAQWAIRDSAQRLSPLSPSPGLLSPWSTGPTSDASSIGSVSPSPSRPGFPSPSLLSDYASIASRAGRSPNPSRHRLQVDDQYVLREEPPIRGRLARRGKPRRSRNPSVTSSVGVPFEYLSIQDAPSAEGSRHSGYDTSPYPHSPTQSSSFQPWNGDWSTLMPQGADDYPSGSASGSIRSLSSLSQAFESDFLNVPGHSSDAGHSRSHSRAPDVDADVEDLAGLHGHGNSGRMTTRAHRRRHSPYPVAGPSTSPGGGGGATGWDGYTNDFTDLSRLGADPSSPSASSLSSWNAGQSSQEDQGAQAYRPVVATPATRRASNRRRKDQDKPGAHVCEYCGNDFTALHNLKFHRKSHLSIKDHECELCGQRFVTPQVLQRHKRTCSTPGSESPVKKKKKVLYQPVCERISSLILSLAPHLRLWSERW